MLDWLPGYISLHKWTKSMYDKNSVFLVASQIIWAFVISIIVFFLFAPQQSLNNFNLLVFLAPLWLTYILVRAAIVRFVQAMRWQFFAKQEYVLLELRMPRETTKTPLAMETFFANLHIGSGETTWYKKYVQGSVRPWWSFEIVSIGGRVHFYIWTRPGFRKLIESYLYSQYPGLEIIEAEDYTRLVDAANPETHSMWGDEFLKQKESPYPIKTYIDYELRPGAKPEENVDPIAQFIEVIGSIGPEEQFWMQYVIRLSKSEKYAPKKTKNGEPYTWKDEAKDLIEKIREQTIRKGKYIDPITGKEKDTDGFPSPTKGQSDTMAAIERNVSKQAFDVGIRSIYVAPNAKFQGTMISTMLAIFKPFSSESLNGFKPAGTFGASFNDYPWEDRKGNRKRYLNKKLLDAYRRRAFYHDPYVGPWSIFSTEELATLYHVPTSGVTTPSLPRIQSATSEAPSNLPT